MDGKFFSFIKSKQDITKIAIVLALGLILIFVGMSNKEMIVPEEGVEEKLEVACSEVEGVGECSVYVNYAPSDAGTGSERVESVLVICEGADSVDVRLRLTEMLSSFFGIGANRIRIEKMKV